MNNLIENLVDASQKIKAAQEEPVKCQWCAAEIPEGFDYCEGTDCEYDDTKWRRWHQ